MCVQGRGGETSHWVPLWTRTQSWKVWAPLLWFRLTLIVLGGFCLQVQVEVRGEVLVMDSEGSSSLLSRSPRKESTDSDRKQQ